MRHTLSLFLTLTAFWLLNSGIYTTLIIMLGVVSILLVLVICHRMDVVDQESQPLHLSRNIFTYYLWLVNRIVQANIVVVKHIFLGNTSISPTLCTLKINQKSDMGKVIYANSITLTPGTVAIDVIGDQITVHALLAIDIDILREGEMDRRVCQLEHLC
ncbi:MAG: cation transporter [Gammaproteobacteria bacterium]|nr:MAG: cation transporter [Gammaproteobacteria bacterium]